VPIKGSKVGREEREYAQPCAARGSRESERRTETQEGSRRETIMIRRGEKGDVRGEFDDDTRHSSRRTGTRFGGPMDRRPAITAAGSG
jgi:hypothetical protein